jgi:hypothetical protein
MARKRERERVRKQELGVDTVNFVRAKMLNSLE